MQKESLINFIVGYLRNMENEELIDFVVSNVDNCYNCPVLRNSKESCTDRYGSCREALQKYLDLENDDEEM